MLLNLTSVIYVQTGAGLMGLTHLVIVDGVGVPPPVSEFRPHDMLLVT